MALMKICLCVDFIKRMREKEHGQKIVVDLNHSTMIVSLGELVQERTFQIKNVEISNG